MNHPYRGSVPQRAPKTTLWRLCGAWTRGTFRKLEKHSKARYQATQIRQMVERVMAENPSVDRQRAEELVRVSVEEMQQENKNIFNANAVMVHFGGFVRYIYPFVEDYTHRK